MTSVEEDQLLMKYAGQAAASVLASRGGAQEKCHGRLAVWDGTFQISSRYRRSFQERIGWSAEFVPKFSSTSPEHAVLLDTLCQHCRGFPRPTVFLTVLLLSASWYCGATSANQHAAETQMPTMVVVSYALLCCTGW